MSPAHAIDGLIVSGPYGIGELRRQPNGWDLLIGETIRQSIDLSAYEPTTEPVARPSIVEIHTGDRIAPKVIGKQT
jgi:hypothetical protein